MENTKDLGCSGKSKTNEVNIGLQTDKDIGFDKEMIFNTFFTSIASNLVSKLPD